MLKDGRYYLVHCTWNTDVIEQTWEIIRWCVPNGFSDPFGREHWTRSNGIALKIDNCTFGEFYELDQAIQLLRCAKMAGVDYGKSKS